MVPSLDLQLQAAIKALSDTMRPALDPANKMAAEQLHIVIASLAMVRERLPVQRRFIRRLLEDAIALAEAVNVTERHDGLTASVAAARAALDDPELEADELESTRAQLTSVTVQLIQSAGAEGLGRFGAVVARGTRISLDRLRAWSAGSGFEPDQSAVKSLQTLI